MLSAVRGGGLRGMAAMPVWRDLNEEVQIWRPLLAYAAAIAAKPDFSSNCVNSRSLHYFRLQQKIIPIVAHTQPVPLPQWQQRIPNFEQQICANVRLLQEDLQLLDELIESEYQRISPNGIFTLAQICRSKFEIRCCHCGKA
jgi:tRNA(Ile)-lysidine synthase